MRTSFSVSRFLLTNPSTYGMIKMSGQLITEMNNASAEKVGFGMVQLADAFDHMEAKGKPFNRGERIAIMAGYLQATEDEVNIADALGSARRRRRDAKRLKIFQYAGAVSYIQKHLK